MQILNLTKQILNLFAVITLQNETEEKKIEETKTDDIIEPLEALAVDKAENPSELVEEDKNSTFGVLNALIGEEGKKLDEELLKKFFNREMSIENFLKTLTDQVNGIIARLNAKKEEMESIPSTLHEDLVSNLKELLSFDEISCVQEKIQKITKKFTEIINILKEFRKQNPREEEDTIIDEYLSKAFPLPNPAEN